MWSHDSRKGKILRTTSLCGFLQLYVMAGSAAAPAAARSVSSRNKPAIREWLDRVAALAAEDDTLALAVASAPRLVKGYGDTRERRKQKLRHRDGHAPLAPPGAGRRGALPCALPGRAGRRHRREARRRPPMSNRMRIACLGGGPAGLYFSILIKKARPHVGRDSLRAQPAGRHVRVGRRLLRQDHGRIPVADPETHAAITGAFRHWDDIEVHFKGPHVHLRRPRLLRHRPPPAAPDLPRAREGARRLTRVPARGHGSRPYAAEYDLVVASDGAASATRKRYADVFRPNIQPRTNRFIWLGSTRQARRLHVRLPRDGVGLVQSPRLPLR